MKKIDFASKVHYGAIRPIDMKSTKYKVTYGILSLIMLLYLVIVFLPVVWMMLFGFKDTTEIYARVQTFLPKEIKLSKMGEVWNQLELYRYYLNTFIMAIGNVLMDVVVCGLAGYSLSRLKPRGHAIYMTAVTTLMLVPATCAMVPNYIFFKDMGLLDTYIPMWLLMGTNMFDILLFKSTFDGISKSLIEAAKIDGASDLRIFVKIVVPLSVPVICTCAIFTFNNSIGDFFWPYLIIQDAAKVPLGVRMFEISKSTLSIDKQMIALIFSIIPQMVVFILFQKQIMGGINLGGVKG